MSWNKKSAFQLLKKIILVYLTQGGNYHTRGSDRMLGEKTTRTPGIAGQVRARLTPSIMKRLGSSSPCPSFPSPEILSYLPVTTPYTHTLKVLWASLQLTDTLSHRVPVWCDLQLGLYRDKREPCPFLTKQSIFWPCRQDQNQAACLFSHSFGQTFNSKLCKPKAKDSWQANWASFKKRESTSDLSTMGKATRYLTWSQLPFRSGQCWNYKEPPLYVSGIVQVLGSCWGKGTRKTSVRDVFP